MVLSMLLKVTLQQNRNLSNSFVKTAIVTGACTAGIGFQTAVELAVKGCRVIIADKIDGTGALNEIKKVTQDDKKVLYKFLDLASLESVRQFANDINKTEERLDILVNNAGVGSYGNNYTKDGLHVTMQINHFGPFLLTHLLVDLLKKSAPSRIIFVSSGAAFLNNLSIENLNYPITDHQITFWDACLIYGNSKLCNIISSNGFAERLKKFKITSNSLHPGMVNTNFYVKSASFIGIENIGKIFQNTVLHPFGLNPKDGAKPTLYLALSDNIQNTTGKYFWDNCTEMLTPGCVLNKYFCEKIWEASEEFVGLESNERIRVN